MNSKKQFRVLLVGIAVMFLIGVAVATAHNKVVVIPLMSDCSAVPTVTSAGGRVWLLRWRQIRYCSCWTNLQVG